jgi:hypothetical protein
VGDWSPGAEALEWSYSGAAEEGRGERGHLECSSAGEHGAMQEADWRF